MRGLLVFLMASVACAQDTAPAPGRVRDPGPEGLRAAEAVDHGLRWLAAHQDVDEGRWDAKGFMKHDPAEDRCDGAGNALFDVGLTGLATLAFLGGGFTDRGEADENPHARTVRQALRYLMSQQKGDGCFGPRSTHAFMYNHTIATLALCDAFAMTRNPGYRRPAEDGIAFILKAQNPGAGWRYDPRGGESDTSVTAWCVMALSSARRCGFEVPQQAFDDAVAWVDRMTEPNFGQVGYNYPGGACCRYEAVYKRFPAERSEAMTAAGIRIRLVAGQDPAGTEAIRKGVKLCLAKPPAWDGASNDMYYWYFGTLALHRVGGEDWRTWRTKLEAAVLDRQHAAGSRAGSWDPIDPWGLADGGRLYSTALLTMCLEIRYDRAAGARRGDR